MKTLLIVNAIRRAQVKVPVDIDGLCRELGIFLHQVSLDEAVSGEIFPVPSAYGSYQINVNSRHSGTRQRFTVSHELGHYVYHRHLIGSGISDDRAYRSGTIGRFRNLNIGPKEETQANKFAVNLLLPENLIKNNRETGKTVEEMAELFQVSPRAMSIRLSLSI